MSALLLAHNYVFHYLHQSAQSFSPVLIYSHGKNANWLN